MTISPTTRASLLLRLRDPNVLVVVGGARCGACFLLSGWLDDQHDTIAKDFVVVKTVKF